MEQGPIVLGLKGGTSWRDVDALSGFDPTPAIFESLGLVRVLDVGKVCSLVLMNKEFIAKNPDVAVRVMQSIKDAYDFYRQNVAQANTWFMEEAQLKNADQKACNIAASIEPNIWVKSRNDINVTFADEDFALMQKGADFIAPMVKKRIDMREFVTNEFAVRVK